MTKTLRELRLIGAGWIVLAPIAMVLASISTVRDETLYLLQLATCASAATIMLVFGVAAVLRQTWARPGLLVLSVLAAAIVLGPGLWLTEQAHVEKRSQLLVMGLFLGLAFVAIAIRLHQLGRMLNQEAP